MLINRDNQKMPLSVGPLLYMPALRQDIAEKISTGTEGLRSAAICLEDTIRDDMVEAAENNLIDQLFVLKDMVFTGAVSRDKLPMIFIRVREPEQITTLAKRAGECMSFVTGFILPKIDDIEMEKYMGVIKETEKWSDPPVFMPIIENPSLLRLSDRYVRLERLRDMFREVKDRILNVRIGGNDFCRTLSLRADITQTIYDIPPVAALLSDISATFCGEFVVSAPVWNYFEGDGTDLWKKGMEREMLLDKSMGFVGKTIIHPCQISAVNSFMAVPANDYNDARLIMNTMGSEIQVVKGSEGNRMYESKIHCGWAEKTLCLAEIYGVRS